MHDSNQHAFLNTKYVSIHVIACRQKTFFKTNQMDNIPMIYEYKAITKYGPNKEMYCYKNPQKRILYQL